MATHMNGDDLSLDDILRLRQAQQLLNYERERKATDNFAFSINRCKGCTVLSISVLRCQRCKRPELMNVRKHVKQQGLYDMLQEDAQIDDSMTPVDKQIVLNSRIIRTLSARVNYNTIAFHRRNLAIYRLYRYCDVPLWMIKDITEMKQSRLQYIIGQVFRALCLSDNACVFRRILQDVYSRHT